MERLLCVLGEPTIPSQGTPRGDTRLGGGWGEDTWGHTLAGAAHLWGQTPSRRTPASSPPRASVRLYPPVGPPAPQAGRGGVSSPPGPSQQGAGPPGGPGPSTYSLASRRVVSSSCVVRESPAPRDAIRKCTSLKSRMWSRLCFWVTDRTSCHRSPTDTPGDTGGHPQAWHERCAHGPLAPTGGSR